MNSTTPCYVLSKRALHSPYSDIFTGPTRPTKRMGTTGTTKRRGRNLALAASLDTFETFETLSGLSNIIWHNQFSRSLASDKFLKNIRNSMAILDSVCLSSSPSKSPCPFGRSSPGPLRSSRSRCSRSSPSPSRFYPTPCASPCSPCPTEASWITFNSSPRSVCST